MEDDSNTSKVLWFIAGASIGASIALLFAPASGATTRSAIAEKSGGRDVVNRGRDLFERVRQLAGEAAEMFEKGRKLIEDTAANVQQG